MRYDYWKSDQPKKCAHCGQDYEKQVFAMVVMGKKGVSTVMYYIHENCVDHSVRTLKIEDRDVGGESESED